MGTLGRAVLVTGGGGGLGRAIGLRLAADGARVGLVGRTLETLESAAGAIREAGGEATPLVADVRDAPGLRAAFGRFRKWAGGFDALVCTAGTLRAVGPLAGVDFETWWRDLETTLRGAAVALREALPDLRQSDAPSATLLVGPGHNGELPFASGYAAGQAGLVRLVESVGREWLAEKIPVYALNPGVVATDFLRRLVDGPDGRRWLPQFNEALAEGKEVGPEVAAAMVAWLVDRRPAELSGRVVAALMDPELLASRLDRVRDENRNVLRLR